MAREEIQLNRNLSRLDIYFRKANGMRRTTTDVDQSVRIYV